MEGMACPIGLAPWQDQAAFIYGVNWTSRTLSWPLKALTCVGSNVKHNDNIQTSLPLNSNRWTIIISHHLTYSLEPTGSTNLSAHLVVNRRRKNLTRKFLFGWQAFQGGISWGPLWYINSKHSCWCNRSKMCQSPFYFILLFLNVLKL